MAGTTLGQLIVQLAADTAKFEGDLGRAATIAESHMKNIKDSTERAIGAVVVSLTALGGALATAFGSGVSQIEDIKKFAQQVGMTAEQFTKLEYAAKVANVSTDELRQGLRYLNREIAAAEGGSAKAQSVLSTLLGPDWQKKTKDTHTAVLSLADAFGRWEDSGTKTADAMAAMGRRGDVLIPLLNQLSTGIEDSEKRAASLGLTFTELETQGVSKFDRGMKDLHAIVDTFGRRLAIGLSDPLAKLIDQMVDAYQKTNHWAEALENTEGFLKGMFSAIAVVAGALKLIGNQLGNTAAQVEALAHGDFARVWELMKMGAGDAVQTVKSTLAQLNIVWDDAARKRSRSIEEALNFTLPGEGPQKGKAPVIPDLGALASSTAEEDIAQKLQKLFQRVGEENNQFMNQNLQDMLRWMDRSANVIIPRYARMWEEMQEIGKRGAQGIQDVLTAFMFDPFANSLKGWVVQFARVIQAMVAEAAALRVMKSIFGGTEEGGLGGVFGNILYGITGGAPKFASGGSFTVGGSGGTDSSLVAFHATPGERVTVGGGAEGMNFAPTYIINAPNGDQQLRLALPGLLSATAARTKQDLLDAFRRNNLRAPSRA